MEGSKLHAVRDVLDRIFGMLARMVERGGFMLGLWKESRHAQTLVFEHLVCVRETMTLFSEAVRANLARQDKDAVKMLALQTHRAEGRADDVRRRVEQTLIGGALLAPLRRQVLEVIDRVDTLANAAEATLDFLLVQAVEIPREIAPKILEILDETDAVFLDVDGAIRALFEGDREEVQARTDCIEKGEARVDRLERKLLKGLFASGLDLSRKLHIAGFVDCLVKISDRAEDLSDQIHRIAAERAA